MKLRDKARLLITEEIDRLKKIKESKLPSERELCDKLGLSRVTIRSALSELELEGKLLRIQGSGTFINPESFNLEMDLNLTPSYDQLIENMGYKLEITTIKAKIIPMPDILLKKPNFNGNKVIKTSRIFWANDMFCVLCIDYIPLKFENEIDIINSYPNSIFEYLYKNHNLKIETSSVKWKIASPEYLKPILENFNINLPKTKSLLLSSSLEYDHTFNPILYTEEFINTDIIEFKLIRRRAINYLNYN